MKQQLLFLMIPLLVISFFGCSVNKNLPTECVSDSLGIIPTPEMYIESDVPQGATLSLSRDDGRYSLFTHPDYEITQEIFAAESWDAAFRHVSGREQEELRPFFLGQYPQEKYRCTWTAAGEEGTDLCQSLIFYDGSFYYAISIQCGAEEACTYADAFSDLLSGAELCYI